MKKFIIAFLLSCSLLLPACGLTAGESGSHTGSVGGGESVGEPCAEHADSDDNGVCDECKASVLARFDFFAVNDLHGKFDDTDAQPGVDELTTYIKQTRASNENTVVLSSGDMWQGSPASNLTRGAIVTEWMNELDFVSMTLGNHEYDWGAEYIEMNQELADFPFLALNIFDRETNERVDYCQPSVMVEQNGVKLGIIGAIGDCYSSISADKVEDVYFKTGAELSALVKEESTKLRADGADMIVYSVHDGYDGYDEELSNGYVDLVFEGHTHAGYVERDSYGVYHLQNRGDNGGVSHAKVTVNFANESCSVNTAEFVRTNGYTGLDGDPIVETLKDKYAETIAPAYEELGQNDLIRDGNEIRSICASLYYKAGMERWGSEYDIALGGGYMSIRAPYELHTGTVVYGDLMDLLPFDNALVLCSIPGEYLRSQFFETTNSSYFIAWGEYGASIRDSIRDSETYYVVVDTYSSQYAPNHLTEIERYDDTTFARDLLAEYVREGGLTKEISLTSFADIYEIGEGLAANEETSETYFVEGKILSIEGPASNGNLYGNMTIQDADGNTLYIYGTYDKEGNLYGNMPNPPQVGDTVVLQGSIKRYVKGETEKIELIAAIVWKIS